MIYALIMIGEFVMIHEIFAALQAVSCGHLPAFPKVHISKQN